MRSITSFSLLGTMSDMIENNLIVQEQILTENRDFIVKHLDADDVIDELIQDRLIGPSAAQRLQLTNTSRRDKNRIICEQLTTAGPDAVDKFCTILRNNRRQTFIAERLQKCLHSATTWYTSGPATAKSSSVDVTRLQYRYLRQPPTSKTDWPMHRVTQYVRLALVEKEDVTIRDEKLNEITKLTLQGDVDKILKKKKPLSDLKDIFHYQNKPIPRMILLMGAPGIGKTTLANEICVKWARDGFLAEDFDVVLLIPLRAVQERSVEQVMVEYIGGEEAYEQVNKSAGARCLVILEGLDEIGVKRQEKDKFLVCVVKTCTLLEQATILITSRPHACEKVKADRRVEIVGFGSHEIEEFVKHSFADSETESVREFFMQLNDYPQIHSLCYIPINLVIIVDIFQVNKKKLPSTLTELYQLFIVMILQRHIEKGSEQTSRVQKPMPNECILYRTLKGIPKGVVRTVFTLSRLVYFSFFDWYSNREGDWSTMKDPKIIFTMEDLNQCGIEVTTDWDGYGLLKATHTHQLPIDTITYNFVHLTIQEFLCALYLSTLSDQKQQHMLSEHFDDYPNVFIFLCGLTRLVLSPTTSQFVYKVLQDDSRRTVVAAKCVFECQLTSQCQSTFPFVLSLHHNTLQPFDCLCVSYVLSCYPVLKLDIGLCYIGNNGAEMLGKVYSSNNTSNHVLQELILYDNNLTVVGVGHVMKIVMKSSASLRVLNIGNNPISDDGISLIVEGCQHTNLLELRVHKCGLSVKGAWCIGELLQVNTVLQELMMGRNNFGDHGISIIAGALGKSRVRNLDLYECGITVAGAKELARGLSINSSITVLSVRSNIITVEGARLILKSAVDNGVCEEVGIDGVYKPDIVVQKLMNILETRQESNLTSVNLLNECCSDDDGWEIPK
ncbi:NACHT, LRR and PYD domains-containing protein 3-like isoform X2 [Dysidea avara]|uniref:NACHT, LRR and PYD domains-containing protein 3-like isoform X2 n=1 Tax=Dysidea avara TaxID=196820 RepID=UPI0033301662